MNTDIRSLQLLERDLDEVVARELDRLASLERALGDGGPGGPRRLPRHGDGRGGDGGRRWLGVAAAVMAVLVVAGGIGFLTQRGVTPQLETVADGGGGANETTVATAGGTGDDVREDAGPPGSAGFIDAGDEALTDAERPGFSYDATTGGTAGSPPRQGIGGVVPGPQGDLTKIVRDGRIGLVIADGSFSRGVSRVTQIARQNGGFVLSSSSQDERSGTMVLRIPARRFDDAMLALRGLAGDLEGAVEFQDITGEDVTAEFIDLRARLDILKTRRALLLQLQRAATSSNEIIRLASLIEDVQLQIETFQGRLNFLKDQVAEATIRVEVRERAAQGEESGPDPQNPNLADSFELAVQGFLRIVGAIVIGLGYLIPLGVLALIGYGVFRLVRRRDRVAS